ncbi:MAG: 50S ribosomal protein L6 [Deinococcales bacterium]|jgi:large subunit ribosomal protein L6
MSRVGRAPITLPKGVELQVVEGNVKVKGPKGDLSVDISPRITVKVEEGVVTMERPTDHRNDRAQHGLARSLVANAVAGVSTGFQKHLEIQGVGYRCQMKGSALELTVGYSHPVVITPPEGVTIEAPEPTKITVSGIDKQLVGQVAANIRAVRKPDHYHGKGVRYAGEQIRLKAGKAAAR